MKIKSIKGRETFEGITDVMDLSMMSPGSSHHDIEMLSSPVALPFQACSSQAASSELMEPAEFHNQGRESKVIQGLIVSRDAFWITK